MQECLITDSRKNWHPSIAWGITRVPSRSILYHFRVHPRMSRAAHLLLNAARYVSNNRAAASLLRDLARAV